MDTGIRDFSDCVGYCRVSTQKQFEEGHGLERYIAQLKSWGLSDNQIFWDIESGASDKRKGYNKVLDLIKSGSIKKLIIPCFDRFTRSTLQWEQASLELQKHNVTVVFLDGGSTDLTSPDDLFKMRILAAMSAAVRDKNKFNSSQGHKFRRLNEKAHMACFGYKKSENGDTLIINHDSYKETDKTYYQLARELITLFLEKRSLSGTARIMCERYRSPRLWPRNMDFPHTKSALKDWLTHPMLRGHLVYFRNDPEKELIITNKFEPIMTEAEFYEVESIINQKRKTKYKKDVLVNPFMGLAVCTGCGSFMKIQTSQFVPIKNNPTKELKKIRYLICEGAYPRPEKPRICDRRSSFGLKLEDCIDTVISTICLRAETVAELGSVQTDKTIEETAEITELRQQINKLVKLGDNDLTEIIQIKQTKLNNLLNALKKESAGSEGIYEKLLEYGSKPEFWKVATVDEMYVLFQDLVERVECDRGSLTVKLKI